MLLIVLGGRSCDGDAAACQARHDLGGWGPTQPGVSGEWIPNHDVSVTNNVFLNPAGSATLYDTITIGGPADPPPDSNIPSPALADDGLNISGNVFWNGGADHNLGVDDPARAAQLQQSNQIGTIEPARTHRPLEWAIPCCPQSHRPRRNPSPRLRPTRRPNPRTRRPRTPRKQLGHHSQGQHGHKSAPIEALPEAAYETIEKPFRRTSTPGRRWHLPEAAHETIEKAAL